MHILAPQAGRIDDGQEAVDLGQAPGDILILSAADSELSAFSSSHKLRHAKAKQSASCQSDRAHPSLFG